MISLEQLEDKCPPSVLDPLSPLSLGLWLPPVPSGPSPAGQCETGATAFTDSSTIVPEAYYPEIYFRTGGIWTYRQEAPYCDWYDLIRVISPTGVEPAYRQGSDNQLGSWVGHDYAQDGIYPQIDFMETGVYAVQSHLHVAGITTTTFVFAKAGKGDTGPPSTSEAPPVKIPISRGYWNVIAVSRQEVSDDYIDAAANIPGVNARPSSVLDLNDSINNAWLQHGRRPINVVLITHGDVNSFFVGSHDFLRGDNEYTVRLAGGGVGKIHEFRIIVCHTWEGYEQPDRYPNHVVRELARGLYSPLRTEPVTLSGYAPGCVYAIDNGWSWAQLARDAYAAVSPIAHLDSYTYPEILPVPRGQ